MFTIKNSDYISGIIWNIIAELTNAIKKSKICSNSDVLTNSFIIESKFNDFFLIVYLLWLSTTYKQNGNNGFII